MIVIMRADRTCRVKSKHKLEKFFDFFKFSRANDGIYVPNHMLNDYNNGKIQKIIQ